MSELIRELEEDMRRDRAKALWDEYGKWLIAISVAIIVGTAAGVVWKNYALKQNEARTDQLLATYDRATGKEAKDAKVILDEVIKTGGSHAPAALAQLRAAELSLSDGDLADAQKRYGALADTHADEALRAVAFTMKEHMQTQQGEKQAASPSVAATAPLAAVQQEALAWHALQQGKKDEAAKLFAAIKAQPLAPAGTRQRATQALAYLGVDAAPATKKVE
jgi:hypothetical protein